MDRQTRIQSDIDRIAQTDAPPGGGPPIPGGPGGPPGKPGGGGPKPGPPPMPGGPRCCTVRVDACQSVGVDVRVLVLTHVTRLVDTRVLSIHQACRYTSLVDTPVLPYPNKVTANKVTATTNTTQNPISPLCLIPKKHVPHVVWNHYVGRVDEGQATMEPWSNLKDTTIADDLDIDTSSCQVDSLCHLHACNTKHDQA